MNFILSVFSYKFHARECFENLLGNKIHDVDINMLNENKNDWLLQKVGVFYLKMTESARAIVLRHHGDENF